MKVNKRLEQAVYVMTMLALQKDHEPVKSHVLSEVLQVSDSYLKKILGELVRADLIRSNASRSGGYQLARPVEQISLKDIFVAIELTEDLVQFHQMASQVYDDKEHVAQVEEQVKSTFDKALDAFCRELEGLRLSDLLHQEAYENGAIDWTERLKA